MPETRHVSETETLVIKDDTITFMTRQAVSGIGTRSRIPWTRWRTVRSDIFSWKSGYLNHYTFARGNGRKYFLNVTNRPHVGIQGFVRDEVLAEKIGVPMEGWRTDAFTRALFHESYPLLRENPEWKATQGATKLLRATDLGVGVQQMFGKARRTDQLEDAVLGAPLSRVVFVSQFRGLVNQGELLDALVSSSFNVDSNQTSSAYLRSLRKLIYDMNYVTRKNLLMANGRRMLATIRDWRLLMETQPDWYPRGRHADWDSLRSEISQAQRGIPYVQPLPVQPSTGLAEWEAALLREEPDTYRVNVNPTRLAIVDETHSWNNISFATPGAPPPAGAYRTVTNQAQMWSDHYRGAAFDLTAMGESMARIGVSASEVQAALNSSLRLTEGQPYPIVR